MPPVVDKELCTGCGICYEICPQDVFGFEGSPEVLCPEVLYQDECWYCGACVVDCAFEAIHLKLPLYLHIVPSPALYAGEADEEELSRAAAFSRSIVPEEE